MEKLFLLAFILAKPCFISTEIASVGIGSSVCRVLEEDPVYEDLKTNASLEGSLGSICVYWGKPWSLIVGLEMMNPQTVRTQEGLYLYNVEIMKPQLGLAYLFDSRKMFETGNSNPRIEITGGVSLINLGSGRVLRPVPGYELTWLPSQWIFLKVSHRLLFASSRNWNEDVVVPLTVSIGTTMGQYVTPH